MAILMPENKIKTILLVEDDKNFIETLKYTLESSGKIKVVSAESLAEARSILLRERNTFSLALLDLNLPDASGVDIVDTIHNYGLPSVVLTGNFDQGLSETMFKRGVIDYILKGTPSCLDYVLSVVNRLLANQALKVLVVDDSNTTRRIITGLCKRYQLTVYQAINGVEALKVIDEHPDIRLVLTDYHMPEMDGFKLTQKIRESFPKSQMAIIAISSADQKGLSAQFIKMGANDFIKKPFDSEEFFCRISQNLDSLEYIEKLAFLATRDFLTGLRNRRSFFETADPILAGLKRRKGKAVVAMVDADNFKRVNDTYGHDTGDEVLKAIANTLMENVRESDLIARMGGEEFAIFAVDMEEAEAEKYFNKLREAIARIAIEVHDGQIKPTVSIGVNIGNNGATGDLLRSADECLYEAKETGRNKVIIHVDVADFTPPE